MAAGGDRGAEARSEARQQRRAAAESRRPAIRGAVEAVKARKGKRPDDIRMALVGELAARGVSDLSDEQLDVLTGVVTAPRRTLLRTIAGQVKALGAAFGVLGDISRYSQPRWAWVPDDVPTVPEGEPDVDTIRIDLTPNQLADGRATVARIIATIRDQSEDGDAEQIRPVGTWVCADRDGVIGVRVGRDRIATLTGAQAASIRAGLTRWGGGRALEVDADLLGSAADTAHLDLCVPTPRHA